MSSARDPRPVITSTPVLRDVRCDRCGRSCTRPSGFRSRSPVPEDAVADLAARGLTVEAGELRYSDTRHPADLEIHVDLCRACAVAVLDFVRAGTGGLAAPGGEMTYQDWGPCMDEPLLIRGPYTPQQIEVFSTRRACPLHEQPLRLDTRGAFCSQPGCEVREDWALAYELDGSHDDVR